MLLIELEQLLEGIQSGWWIHAGFHPDVPLSGFHQIDKEYITDDGNKPNMGLWFTPKMEWVRFIKRISSNWPAKHIYKAKIVGNIKVVDRPLPHKYTVSEETDYRTWTYNWKKYIEDKKADGLFFPKPELFKTLDIPSLVIFDLDCIKEWRYLGKLKDAPH